MGGTPRQPLAAFGEAPSIAPGRRSDAPAWNRTGHTPFAGHDPRPAAPIGELATKSPEFASKWSEHRVRMGDLATYRMRHPLAGRMRLNLQALNVPQEEDRRFVVATSDSGTASEAAPRLLAQATVPTAEHTEAAERRRSSPRRPTRQARANRQASPSHRHTTLVHSYELGFRWVSSAPNL
ncbi:hypothetical protein [Streptomyces sp. Agncl-13]|uniref:MmyB family transcriptional regulator n=1 Tax=Streptomyces sp. Agncl-13 TaxID=3400628 RepID=UPI003A8B4EFD